MSLFKQAINRRTFIKLSIQALVLAATSFPWRNRIAGVESFDPQSIAYGSGSYGQGAYDGSQIRIYLPMINKEGN